MIAIIKYNAGNCTSVLNAINKLGYDAVVTDDVNKIRSAEKVILPGVGNAKPAMEYLESRGLSEVIQHLKQPFLGICLGLQLMCETTEEENTKCMGIFPVQVKKFDTELPVPHMGWNTFEALKKDPVLKHIEASDDCYYVHSYYVESNQNSIAKCNYSVSFGSILRKNNFIGMQFHPEKSGSIGAQLLKNFLEL